MEYKLVGSESAFYADRKYYTKGKSLVRRHDQNHNYTDQQYLCIQNACIQTFTTRLNGHWFQLIKLFEYTA